MLQNIVGRVIPSKVLPPLLLLLALPMANAATIAYNLAVITTCVGSFGAIGNPPDPCTPQMTSSGATISSFGSITTSGENLSYSASSVSTPGELGGVVSVTSNTINSSGPGVMVDALEQLVDSVVISYAPLNGQTGYLFLDYTLDGTNSSSGADAPSYGCVKLGINDPLFPFGCSGHFQPSVSGTFSSGVFPFIYGQAFPLWFQLESIAGTGFGSGRATGAGSASADFYNTATIAGVVLFDQNMDELSPSPGIDITSTLGVPLGDLNTPEPDAWLLAAFAAALWPFVRRRRLTNKLHKETPDAEFDELSVPVRFCREPVRTSALLHNGCSCELV